MLNTLTRLLAAAALLVVTMSAPASERDIRNSVALGALAFADNCQKCHQIDGYGEEALYPSLHTPELLADKTLLIQTVLNGRLGHQEGNDNEMVRLMPAMDFLSNTEIAAIIAFISNSWGDEVVIVTVEEVEDAR